MSDEILIQFGGEVKAAPGGDSVSGHLVRYTTQDEYDLARDWFDSATDFGFRDKISTPVYLNHRMPMKMAGGGEVLVRQKVGEGELVKADTGVLIDAILYNREMFGRALEVMGWSSGTARHCVDRTKTGKSFHVDQWPLGVDASLTPIPCDPVNVCSLKSFQGMAVKSLPVLDAAYFIAQDELKAMEETANEYRVRLKDPADFEDNSFRRIPLQKKKPRVFGIVGKEKNGDGTMVLQSLRFPKDEGWTPADVTAWVKQFKGAAASAGKSYDLITEFQPDEVTVIHRDDVFPQTPGAVKAVWDTSYINDLPDSAFLYIEDGGEKDSDGKTKPRSLRHFPYKDASGKVDLPHLRNALARIPQSSLSQDIKDRVIAKAQRIAKANGIDTGGGGTGKSLSAKLCQFVDDLVDEGRSRESIVKSLAGEAGVTEAVVEQILGGEIARPSNARLKAFARVLDVDFNSLVEAAERISAKSIKGIFEEILADHQHSRWELDSAYCSAVSKIATVAAATSVTGVPFDLKAKLGEATREYMTRLESLALTQVQEYVDTGRDEPFYLKAIINFSDADNLAAENYGIEDHSSLAVAAVRGVQTRFRKNYLARQSETKAGRTLSEKNRQRLGEFIKQITAAVTECQNLLDETQPMASDSEKRAAITESLRLRHRELALRMPASQE